MSELIELRARIKSTEVDLADAKADLAKAKREGNEARELLYEQKLVELLRKENRLEERAAALAGEYSHPSVLLARGLPLLLLALFPERACLYSAVHSNSPCTFCISFLLFLFDNYVLFFLCAAPPAPGPAPAPPGNSDFFYCFLIIMFCSFYFTAPPAPAAIAGK